MAKVSGYDDEGVGASADVPADQIRTVLADAVYETGDLPLPNNEERLAVAILEGLERSVQTLPEHGRLDGGRFADVVVWLVRYRQSWFSKGQAAGSSPPRALDRAVQRSATR